MLRNMLIDDNSQNLNPTQQQELISLQKQMAEHMLTNFGSYKHLSPIEKIRWADRAVNLVADYTCLKMGIDRSAISNFFFTGSSPMGMASHSDDMQRFAVALSVQQIIKRNPLSIYKTVFHELRHIAQYAGKVDEAENISFYAGPYTKTTWSASPSEKGADKFAYKEVAALLGRGMLKASTAVKAVDLAPGFYFFRGINAFGHAYNSGVYARQTKNNYSRDLSKGEVPPPPEKVYGKVLKSEPRCFLERCDIERLAEGSYLFFKNQNVATKKQLKQKAQKVADSLEQKFTQKPDDEFKDIETLPLQPENNAMLQNENLDLQLNLGVEEIVGGILKAKTKDEDFLTIETLKEESGQEVTNDNNVDLPNQTALENLTETTVDLKTTEDVATPATIVKPVGVTPIEPIQ